MTAGGPGAPRIPLATYRLQFNRDLTFTHAAEIVPYLAALGISDLYASSYLAARPGSLHGYDIADHNALNPELGTEQDYRRLVARLGEQGMGQILDVVPNHMGIAEGCNRWWNDVLENGPSSPYAEFFDIDWEPVKRELQGKVLLPILEDQFGRVLENQALALRYEDGAFAIHYHATRLPLEPRSSVPVLAAPAGALGTQLGEDDPQVQEYRSILTGLGNLPPRTETAPDRVRERMREKEVLRRRLAQLAATSEPIRAAIEETVRVYNGKAGDPRSFDLLDRLLTDQVYRLAYWRVAAEEINYRRFFDINELAAIRMEHDAVFAESHRLILRLVAEGAVTGLRVDHPDGLYDPAGYFQALQQARAAQIERARLDAGPAISEPDREAAVAGAVAGFDAATRPLYVVAEKILARGERLPADWAIHGTTGYEFLNLAGALLVDPGQERAATAAYAAFTGQRRRFADLTYEAKQLIMDVSMASELQLSGHALSRLSERNRYARDFTLASLTHALKAIIACFPVYRTYIRHPAGAGGAEVSLQDRACVEVAVAFAIRRNPTTNVSVFDFVRDVLLLRYPEQADEAYRRDQLAFVGRFQQLTAPVTAKGVEDTAFYRYHRLVSLNEVGGEPERFGVPVEEFHRQCQARQEQWPAGLSATATHDTKRGEDVRARIAALSELLPDWRAAVTRWHRFNLRHRTVLDGQPAPDRNDEYLLYQTLVGAWPFAIEDATAAAAFTARVQAYMLKAAREAKLHTSWINPNPAYDDAVQTFVAKILTRSPANRFLADLAAFQAPVARLGMVGGLATTLLKIAAPGVPDFYQGSELWDLSLVDPDNRRPVDFADRRARLEALAARIQTGDLRGLARELIERWTDGGIKLYVIHRGLGARQATPALYRQGRYIPLAVAGPADSSVCAFARRHGSDVAIVVVPRLVARLTGKGARLPLGLETWGDTRVLLPVEVGAGPFIDRFTGVARQAAVRDGQAVLAVGDVLADVPVALLSGRAADGAEGTL